MPNDGEQQDVDESNNKTLVHIQYHILHIIWGTFLYY